MIILIWKSDIEQTLLSVMLMIVRQFCIEFEKLCTEV